MKINLLLLLLFCCSVVSAETTIVKQTGEIHKIQVAIQDEPKEPERDMIGQLDRMEKKQDRIYQSLPKHVEVVAKWEEV